VQRSETERGAGACEREGAERLDDDGAWRFSLKRP